MRVFLNSRKSTLVKGHNLQVLGRVFLDNTGSIRISVEGIHQYQRNLNIIFFVEVLDNADYRIRIGLDRESLGIIMNKDVPRFGEQSSLEMSFHL